MKHTIISTIMLASLAFAGIAHAEDTCGDVLSEQVYDCITTFANESTAHTCITFDEAVGELGNITGTSTTAQGALSLDSDINCGCTLDKPEEEFICIGTVTTAGPFLDTIYALHAELDVNDDFTSPAYTSRGGRTSLVCEQAASCTP